jgi:hypothetical protein
MFASFTPQSLPPLLPDALALNMSSEDPPVISFEIFISEDEIAAPLLASPSLPLRAAPLRLSHPPNVPPIPLRSLQMLSEDPPVISFEDFISEEEIAALLKHAEGRFVRSTASGDFDEECSRGEDRFRTRWEESGGKQGFGGRGDCGAAQVRRWGGS